MSNRNFVKGACRQCGGHLEFPADAAGQIIDCPHCGKPTELAATVSPNKNTGFRLPNWIAVVLLLAVAISALALFIMKRPILGPPGGGGLKHTPRSVTATTSNLISTQAPTNLPAQTVTNDFALLPFKLEKTPGGSLVHVTGTVRNQSGHQRFGVKIAFELFDTNDIPVGKATDYQSVLEPHGDWHFKALVIGSKVASAQFQSIAEAQ